MQRVTKSVLVPFAATRMFELVDRVEEYPQFLPWCGGAKVLEQSGDRKTARIDIDYHGVRAHFTTDNVNRPPESIVITLKDVLVSSVSSGSSRAGTEAIETVSLVFSSANVKFRPQDAEGKLGNAIEANVPGSCP